MKHATVSAIFDRIFYKGFRGGIPDLKENNILIIKRPEYDPWNPGKYSFPTETYSSKKDPSLEQDIKKVMKLVAERGFEEEFDPDRKCGSPNLEYVGTYYDPKTYFLVHVLMGNMWSNSPWFSRPNLENMLHTTEEVPKYYWKTLPQIIEMMKQDKIAGEPAVDMIIGEIERRMSLD